MYRWLATLLCAALPLSTPADELPREVVVDHPVADDFYGAGWRVDVRAPIDGDAVVAGQLVHISAPVSQDLMAAGEFVAVEAPVGDDVRVAGREVRIENRVAGHLIAAAETVRVLPGARVGGFAWIVGRNVALEGDVGGNVKITGEEVRIAGHVQGRAEVHARRFELLPGARVDGDLVWSGVERRLDEGSRVGGQFIARPRPTEQKHHLAKVMAAAGALFIGALTVLGLTLFLLFPRAAETVAATVWQAPWVALGLGFAVLVLTPFVVVLLLATLVGWLLALVVLALWLVALPVGSLAGTYALTDRLLGWSRTGRPGMAARAALFALAIVVVGLLHMVPILGWLLGLWLLLWGLGAGLLLAYRASAGRPA